MYRGTGAREKAGTEQEAVQARREARQKEFDGPKRLYLKPGETREICIVDEAPDFFMFEHQIYNGKKPNLPYYSYSGCVKEYETCPACQKHGDSNFNLYLTVIDFAEYTAKNGEVVEFSKKLMVIKSGSQRKFIRRHEKNGSLRGQVVTLTRDGDKDPVIGNDIEWDDKIDEDELTSAYIRSWTDRKKKVHEENCGEVFVYEDIFDEPTIENISAALTGENAVDAVPGSREQAAAELDNEEDADGEDGWEGDAGPEDVPFDTDSDDGEEDAEEDDEAPKRGTTSRSRGGSRGAANPAQAASPSRSRSEGRRRRRL
jgi:hypothetical protein